MASEHISKNPFVLQLTEEANRPKDTLAFAEARLEDGELAAEHKMLPCIAYKQVTRALRSSWLSMFDAALEARNEPWKLSLIQEYKKRIENELSETINRMLDMVDKQLIPQAVNPDMVLVYQKLKADSYRYLADIGSDDEKQAACTRAQEAYQTAYDAAKDRLPEMHPIRLALALNFAVLYKDVIGNPDKARSLAKDALANAHRRIFPERTGEVIQLLEEVAGETSPCI